MTKIKIARLMMYGIIAAIMVTVMVPRLAAQSDGSEELSAISNLQVLEYGIDSEVERLVRELTEIEDDTLQKEIGERFSTIQNRSAQIAIIDYFTAIESPTLESDARTLLNDYRSYHENTILALIRYVQNGIPMPTRETIEALHELVHAKSVSIAQGALQAIGARGTPDDVSFLSSLLTRVDIDTQIVGGAILAIGQAGSSDEEDAYSAVAVDDEVVDILIQYLDNDVERDLVRRYAAESLGQLKNERAIPALLQYVGVDDPQLRASTIRALAQFSRAEDLSLFTEALRDNHWLVRKSALDGLEAYGLDAPFEAIRYKAQHDPNNEVRLSAIDILAKYGDDLSFDLLLTMLEHPLSGNNLRQHIAYILLQERPVEVGEPLLALLEEEWDSINRIVTIAIARYVSQNIFDRRHIEVAEQICERLLEHPDFGVRIHGARAVGINGIGSLYGTLQRLAANDPHGAVKTAARRVLEKAGEPIGEADAVDDDIDDDMDMGADNSDDRFQDPL